MTDDNANYERVKRWRDKHRGLANLRQREYRKRKKGGDAKCNTTSTVGVGTASSEPLDVCSKAAPTVRPSGAAFTTKKVGEFRMLVLPEQPKDEATMPATKPLIFRDDNGRPITERAWNALQKLKEKAEKGGYEIDNYIQ